MELAQYSADEIKRLQKGAQIHNEKKERAAQSGRQPSTSQREREQEALAKFE
jgi:hypothetical protein